MLSPMCTSKLLMELPLLFMWSVITASAIIKLKIICLTILMLKSTGESWNYPEDELLKCIGYCGSCNSPVNWATTNFNMHITVKPDLRDTCI